MNFSVVLQCGWGERLLRWSVPVSGVGMPPCERPKTGLLKWLAFHGKREWPPGAGVLLVVC